jgi:protein-tyrosine phosphatase
VSLLDGLLHPLRRGIERARLRRRDVPKSILFVCRGGLCRSPYAAAAFARRLEQSEISGIKVDSVGFLERTRLPPSEAIRAAGAQGIDLSAHRSTMLTRERVEAADLVVFVEPFHLRLLQRSYPGVKVQSLVLADLDPERHDTRVIADPINQAQVVYEASFARIDRCVAELADAFRRPDR